MKIKYRKITSGIKTNCEDCGKNAVYYYKNTQVQSLRELFKIAKCGFLCKKCLDKKLYHRWIEEDI